MVQTARVLVTPDVQILSANTAGQRLGFIFKKRLFIGNEPCRKWHPPVSRRAVLLAGDVSSPDYIDHVRPSAVIATEPNQLTAWGACAARRISAVL